MTRPTLWKSCRYRLARAYQIPLIVVGYWISEVMHGRNPWRRDD